MRIPDSTDKDSILRRENTRTRQRLPHEGVHYEVIIEQQRSMDLLNNSAVVENPFLFLDVSRIDIGSASWVTPPNRRLSSSPV